MKGEIFCDCDVIHAEVVDRVRKKMPGEHELYDLSDFSRFSATAQERKSYGRWMKAKCAYATWRCS